MIDRGHKDVAIALRYDSGRDAVPVVTATGQGAVAARIVDIARENGVEVREDADLARVLEALEVGQAIPPLAFAAVAEILACLYRRNAELAADTQGASPR